MRSMFGLAVAVTWLGMATAQTVPTAAGAPAKAAGPYAPIGAALDKDKKTKFFGLLKKMREVKNSKDPEAQRNATRRTLNAEMQKLLGDEVYQKYRQARVANTAKAKGGTSTGAAAAPAAPASAAAAAAAAYKGIAGAVAAKKGGKGAGKKKGAAAATG